MSGREACGNIFDSFARAGTFFADGQGHITGGLEDVNTVLVWKRCNSLAAVIPSPPMAAAACT